MRWPEPIGPMWLWQAEDQVWWGAMLLGCTAFLLLLLLGIVGCATAFARCVTTVESCCAADDEQPRAGPAGAEPSWVYDEARRPPPTAPGADALRRGSEHVAGGAAKGSGGRVTWADGDVREGERAPLLAPRPVRTYRIDLHWTTHRL